MKPRTARRSSRGILRALAITLAIAAWAAASSPQTLRPKDLPRAGHAKVDGLALTPPMGGYPWNTFGEEPQNETSGERT